MDDALVWNRNWAWSLPLIVVNVMYHATGLAFINDQLARAKRVAKSKRNLVFQFAFVMGVTTLLATLLHATEA